MTIFSVILALGSMLGLIGVAWASPVETRRQSLNIGGLALLGALVGGRIAYVLVNWAYFQTALLEIPQVWLGGLGWPGSLAGGLVGFCLAAWIYALPVGVLADQMLPLLASVAVAAWAGCWLTGCAYGPQVIWGLPVKDAWGIWEPRFPTQWIAALLTIALLGGIDRLRSLGRIQIPGLAASLGLSGLSLILLGAALLRVDPYPLFNGIRLETWAALFFLGIGLLAGLYALLAGRR